MYAKTLASNVQNTPWGAWAGSMGCHCHATWPAHWDVLLNAPGCARDRSCDGHVHAQAGPVIWRYGPEEAFEVVPVQRLLAVADPIHKPHNGDDPRYHAVRHEAVMPSLNTPHNSADFTSWKRKRHRSWSGPSARSAATEV
jgi:hypothetical protein